MSERRACRVVGQNRSTQRHRTLAPQDEPSLVTRTLQLAGEYGRYGYRRITALLRREGWRVNHKRGTAEQWIKEGKQAVKMTRLSCHRFRSNEVRLWLTIIAYNLGNLWRRLVLPQRIGNWSLTSLQQRLVKTGGRLVKHARYYWLLLAEGHLSRRLFSSMLRTISALPLPDG